jgi:hypothetical protein
MISTGRSSPRRSPLCEAIYGRTAPNCIWLLITAIDARLDWLDRRVGAPLKMSYYTAPNDAALMGLRLLIARWARSSCEDLVASNTS